MTTCCSPTTMLLLTRPRNNGERRCSGVDLWLNLFDGKQVVQSEDEVVVKCPHQEQQFTAKPEECAVLQKDRQRKQERRRKNRKRRNRKKIRSRSPSSDDSDSVSLKESDCPNKRQRSKEKAPVPMESSDSDDDDMIAFEDEPLPRKQPEYQRRISKTPKCPRAFGLFDQEDDQTDSSDQVENDDDDGWDVDDTDHSSDDYCELLDMLGFGGLFLNKDNGLDSRTNCDKSNSKSVTITTTCVTTSSNPGYPVTATTTATTTISTKHSTSPPIASSSAVDIPHQMYVLHYSDDSSCSPFGSMSPSDSMLSPLTKEDIELNRAEQLQAEASRLATADANRRFDNVVAKWKDEMGERAYLIGTDEVERFLNGKEEKIERPTYLSSEDEDDEMFDIEVDETDSPSSTQSSPMIVQSMPITKDQKPQRARTVRISSETPDFDYVEKTSECRKNDWVLDATRRRALESNIAKVLTPEHRERIFSERFAAAGEDSVSK